MMAGPVKGIVLVTAVFAVGGAQAQPAWKPEKPVELIAMNAPGGGPDRILRIATKTQVKAFLTTLGLAR